MIIMKKTVFNYINELAPESKARLTNHFSEEVDEFCTLISQLIIILQNYHGLNPIFKSEDPKAIAYGIMTKGANTLMAAFELILGGYLWEPPILFRNALEGFALAWDIVHNKKRFEVWMGKGKFKSTDSITNLKKAYEPIGQMYGLLSNMYVHISPINASPSVVMSSGEPKLQFFGLIRSGKESIRGGEVHFALIAAYVCLQLTELTFYQYSAALETIEKIPESDYVRVKVSDRHRKFVNTAMEHFKNVVKDPSVCF
jgi:hypothetical protein